MCRSCLKYISPLDFISLLNVLIDICARKLFFFISLNRLVEVVYYLKQVFHLVYDKSVTPAEELFYFYLILWIFVYY